MRHLRFPVVALLCAMPATAMAQPSVPFNDAGVHAVQFIDPSEGWAVGDDGVIWHSIDGGANWERQKSGTRASLRSVHFITPYTGWAVGRTEIANGGGSVGVLLRTTDGGLHWDEIGANVMPGLHTIHFFDEMSGFVCGDGSGAFASGMFTTVDGGHQWRLIGGVKVASCRGAAFFADSRAGVVAGAWSRLGTFTPDGGYREADFDPLAGRTLHAVCCIGSSLQKGSPGTGTAFAVGDGGAVLISTNGGRSWGFANLGQSPETLAVCDFRCVSCVGTHVWVAGKPGGFVFHSADDGKTWDLQKTELPLPINGIHFLTEQVGWMVGEFGRHPRHGRWRQDLEDPAGRRSARSRAVPARITACDAVGGDFATRTRRRLSLCCAGTDVRRPGHQRSKTHRRRCPTAAVDAVGRGSHRGRRLGVPAGRVCQRPAAARVNGFVGSHARRQSRRPVAAPGRPGDPHVAARGRLTDAVAAEAPPPMSWSCTRRKRRSSRRPIRTASPSN